MNNQDSGGLNSREYWSISAVAVACVMLVVINISVAAGNREMRDLLLSQQTFIANTVQLDKLRTQLIKVVAETSVRNNDPALEQLLKDQGITFRVNEAAAPATP